MKLYTVPGLLVHCQSMFQFYLSIMSCEFDYPFQIYQNFNHRNINISQIKYPKHQINNMIQLLPKPIVFKKSPEKNNLVSLIRNLIIVSFYRNRCNFNMGVSIPNKRNIKIIPILYKNAFTIIIQTCNGKNIFNICRENKYSSKKNSNLIYDWKEIQKLNDTLETLNLSLNKLWINLKNCISQKIYNFAVSKQLYSTSLWFHEDLYIGKPFRYRVPIQRIITANRKEILHRKSQEMHFDHIQERVTRLF